MNLNENCWQRISPRHRINSYELINIEPLITAKRLIENVKIVTYKAIVKSINEQSTEETNIFF